MDLYELKKDITSNKLQSLYILYGQEHVVRRIYLDKIAKACGCPLVFPNTLGEIIRRVNTKSLIGSGKIYVIYNDSDIIKNEKSWQILEDIRGANRVILCYESLDERTKFYKHFANTVVKFDRLSPELLIKYITRDYDMSKALATKLINRCDSDYGKITKIGEKINILRSIDGVDGDTAYNVLIKEHQIPISAEKLEFEFVDTVLSGDIEYAVQLLKIMENSYSGLGLISLLYRSFRGLLLVQSCNSKSSADISKRTGVDVWEVNRLKEYVGVYKTSRLVKSLGYLEECDTGVKTGLVGDKECIYHFLCNLLYR